jgi:hypothetical protein
MNVDQTGQQRRRHVRSATWTDEVLEEVYDMRNLPKETAMVSIVVKGGFDWDDWLPYPKRDLFL